MREDPLWALVSVFVPLSFLAFGGGSAILAALEHQTVDVHHWITQREFIDLFALSRAAPGPGSMLATLIGWKVAGWLGALVATAAMFGPASLACYGATRIWNRYRGTVWHSVLETGLIPVAGGLTFAGAFAVLRAAEATPLDWGLAAISAGLLVGTKKIHPLLIIGASGAIYAAFG
jgi:chromate transporter